MAAAGERENEWKDTEKRTAVEGCCVGSERKHKGQGKEESKQNKWPKDPVKRSSSTS